LIALKPPGDGTAAPAASTASTEPVDPKTHPDHFTGHQEGLDGQNTPQAVPAPKPIAARMVATLAKAATPDQPLQRVELANPLHPKFHLVIKPYELPQGQYILTAWLEDEAGGRGEVAEW